MKSKLLAGAVLVLGTLTGACAVSGGYVAVGPPPPPRYGIIGVAPGPGFVWTEGFWDWRGGGYAWVPGRWVRPPHPRAVWVPGNWVERPHHRYEFRRGHWR